MSLWQGKRQEARGKSEEGLGDFTFLYTVWFYCVHLLRVVLWLEPEQNAELTSSGNGEYRSPKKSNLQRWWR
ncbi:MULTISPECIES: hypothetical protein [Nostocales]|uniref:Uncharacterized protein n=2 Tax=Aphanizomenonaceae TaxID=1892259 RepID=A0ACC7SCE4_DOLFA|nr:MULTISPECIES: hypothetical protein [Nostocales]MBO1069278.1 hypothetical protein [Dolichospermum sp. DEX189]MCX5983335.1 hypothetical protein [Nostocales cyanobacterium LacPavin_0920_SED1_MAG_38_18]MBD2279001.1 hypothetical protein [Aphanizomenon flos-aquae FACHB-1040]MBO1064361.1 hypothetical protein [Anabaena sp. 54]MTJ45152.1 hypothetical protein [Dolichospermum flos-aquae UHCC 0037]